MAIVINGSGTVTGLAVGGLPDGTVDTDTLANTTVTAAKVAADVATQAEIDAKLNLAGGTMTGQLNLNSHLDMGDNHYIAIGAGDDFQIYHDGTHSYIKNTHSSGSTRLNQKYFEVNNAAGTESMLSANENSGVSLRYDNVTKLATTNAGATITGDLIVTDTGGTKTSIAIADHDTTAYVGAEAGAACFGRDSAVASANNLMIYADGRGHSQFTAKAWIQMDMSNMSINDSHMFSSVTDIATGQARCNYSYALGSTTPAIATSGPDGYISGTSNINSTSFYLRSGDSNWSAADTDKNMAIVFAD